MYGCLTLPCLNRALTLKSKVQFPKLITSYALPPQSSFQCPPLSLRQKTGTGSTSKRRTYCAIEGPEKEIKCLMEELEAGSRNVADISTSSFALDSESSPAVFIGAVPTVSKGQEESFDVVTVHKDGRVRRLSPDLASERWNISARNFASGEEVQAAFLLGFDEARKSLFRKRQDIIAMILGDRLSASSENSSVLMVVTHPGQTKTIVPKDARVHIYSVPTNVSDGFALSDTQRLRELMTVSLPNFRGRELIDSTNVHWSASSTGELCLSFHAGFINYDLSQYSPAISSHLLLDTQHFSSLLRLSPRAVITANESSVAVYNTHYQSIQAEISVKDALAAAESADSTSAPFEFVSYYSKLAVAVAARDFQLFAFDLESVRGRDPSHRKPRGNLLIDAIGKGVSSESNAQRPALDEDPLPFLKPLGHTSKEDAEQWVEIKAELDAAVQAKDSAKFDNIVRTRFGKPQGEDGKAKKFSTLKEFVDIERIYYLLSTIFSVETVGQGPTAQTKLVVSFWPTETVQWLIGTGRFTLSNIQGALRKAALPRVLPPLHRAALIHALAEHRKGSTKGFLLLLRSPLHLDAVELVTALGIILDIARSHANESDEVPKTLTETPHKQSDEPATEVPRDTNNATTIAEKPTQEPGSAVTNALAALNLTLTRLHSQPTDQVTTAIRSSLSNSDTLSIINHLRHALATGGYTSRYTETLPPIFAGSRIPRLPLPAIVDVLNACIDAVGPSGWISAAGFASGQGSEATLIADLKSEISAVLAGVEEATYMKGILREFIRCCESAAKMNKSRSNNNDDNAVAVGDAGRQRGIKRKERHNGAEIEIYETSYDEASGGFHDTRMLPLSLRLMAAGTSGSEGGASDEPDKMKLLPNGEVKVRSAREVSYLKRKAVGKYSFERIIL